MSRKRQVNIRVDDDLFEVIDEIRRLQSPIPSITEAIVRAVYNERERLRRATKREQMT